MNKKLAGIYMVVAMVILAIPFVGMSVAKTDWTTENKPLSEMPLLVEDGKFNMNFLEECGAYFEDHFAFRPHMVNANAWLQDTLLNQSATDQVILGDDGWMFFSGTMDDYRNENQLSDRGLNNAVHNLRIMQSYVQSKDSQFLLMIVPNKNTLYGEYMPDYQLVGKGDGNLERIQPMLDEAGIAYVNLLEAFNKEDEVLYYKEDSHWTNKGAVLAYKNMMKAIQGKRSEADRFDAVSYDIVKEHMGDLAEMLYPITGILEDNEIYDYDWQYEYVREVVDNMDNWIETTTPGQDGTLLMYRDSFGESLLPFMAEAFENAYFSRLVPYNMANLNEYKPDVVIVERVERRIAAFAEEPAAMQAPKVKERKISEKCETKTTLNTRINGAYRMVTGNVDSEYIQDDSQIYVQVLDGDRVVGTYAAFHTSNQKSDGSYDDNGYMIYLNNSLLESKEACVNIIVSFDGQNYIVKSEKLVFEEENQE